MGIESTFEIVRSSTAVRMFSTETETIAQGGPPHLQQNNAEASRYGPVFDAAHSVMSRSPTNLGGYLETNLFRARPSKVLLTMQVRQRQLLVDGSGFHLSMICRSDCA